MNMRKLMVLLLIIMNVLSLNGIVSFSQETKKNHILVLNSYHQGYTWTDNIVKGIESVLEDENNVIRIEYMDTRIIKDERHLNNLYELYKHKFSNHKFDVIIASDNDAYNFLKKYHKSLFENTPIICCGLNIFDDFITNRNNMFTGVVETVDIKDTIDIAYKLHPNIKNVVVIADESLSGDMNIEITKKVVPLYKGKIKFDFIQNDSIEEILKNIKKIPRNSMIFQAGLYKDKVGEPISIEEGNKIISKAVNIPLYSCWEMNLCNGVIGGKMASGYSQGQTAAQVALKVLEGQNIKDLPFMQKSINKYVFDYHAIRQYNIKLSDLPEGSMFINKPSPFLKIKKSLMYLVIMLISAVLAFFNFILYKNILKFRKAERELQKEKKILQSILDSTVDGILVVDEDRHIVNYNNGFK
ncbi:ABC transporter substrate-binding protein, partial [Anaeromicrobium sediminis]